MRPIVLLVLVACTDKPYEYDTSVPEDTGLGVCGKVRGTTGVLMYEEDDGLDVLPPLDTPNTSQVTTGVAGPIDDVTWLAVTDGDVIRSDDMGCNWTSVGTLPAGDWGLVLAGSTVYGFDRDSSAGARTDDLGLTWSTFDTGGIFASLPTVDAANPLRLRGVQARGVVTSDDGGGTWPVSGGPLATGSPLGASVFPGDLDRVSITGVGGVWQSFNGGTSWQKIYNAGDGYEVVIHPDDSSVTFAIARDDDGTLAGWRHDGTDWTKLVTEDQIAMVDTMELWPVPGNVSKVVSAHGPVLNNDDEESLALYEMTPETGTQTTRVTMYYHLHQLAFGADRWVAAVDSQGRDGR